MVDASIADAPEVGRSGHDWFLVRPGRGPALVRGGGAGRVLGRTCMESDVLHAGLRLPADVRAGDVLVITDVGAYDTSKSYRFGRGEAPWPDGGTELAAVTDA